jgi:hypothetical protein
MGIEPTSSAWKAEVLPLNYTRFAGDARASPSKLEPAAIRRPGVFPESPTRSTFGGGGRIRTYEGVSRQIYSLLPLTAWVPLREKRAAYSDFGYAGCQCVLARELLGIRPRSRVLPNPRFGARLPRYRLRPSPSGNRRTRNADESVSGPIGLPQWARKCADHRYIAHGRQQHASPRDLRNGKSPPDRSGWACGWRAAR